MKVRFLLVLLALPLVAAASRDDVKSVEDALRDLGSPFLEARRSAVESLVRAGAEGDAAMRSAYPKADFRTKVLILDGFVKGRPHAGIELLYGDLASPDRGVVLAQRRLLSALYLRAATYSSEVATAEVKVRDWKTQEGLRALPGSGPRARTALDALRTSEALATRAVGNVLANRVDSVDQARVRLGEVAAGEAGTAADRAGELLARLIRHDTERALLAVFEVSGREGSFDGMFAIVGELVTPRRGKEHPGAIAVLIAIVKDRLPPEEGVPADRRKGYRFLSALPPDGDALTMRLVAANCLGEVGDAAVGEALVDYFDVVQWNSNEEWQDDPDTVVFDDGSTPKLAVAVACADLGRTGPLRKRVKYFEEQLRQYFYGSSLERRTLAMAYARLGEFRKAEAQYEYCLQETPRDGVLWYNLACARSRAGDAYGALKALRRAAASGYGADPSQISWAQRDKDLEPVRKLRGFKELFGE